MRTGLLSWTRKIERLLQLLALESVQDGFLGGVLLFRFIIVGAEDAW